MSVGPIAIGGVFLTLLRWWVIGHSWFWLGTAPAIAPARAFGSLLCLISQVVRGLVLDLLVSICFLALGWWSAPMDWVAAAVLTCAGWILGHLRGSGVGWPSRAVWGWFLILVLLWGVALELADRGEWMAGGWDPGIYIQQGVVWAQQGSWHSAPDSFWSSLSADEIERFTRRSFNFVEAYPVVPLDVKRRSLEPFFFPLTPLIMAKFYRAGGLLAVCRTNELMGCLAALGWAAAIWRMTRSRAATGAALLIFVTHPIWLYHQHFPTSEVVQSCLLAGLAWQLAGPVRRAADQGWAALFFLAAALNRLAFLPFGALLIALDVIYRPGGRGRRYWAAGLLLAGVVDAWAVPITIGRLGRSVTTLVAATLLILMGSALARMALHRSGTRPWVRSMLALLPPATTCVVAGGFGLLWIVRDHAPVWLSAGVWNARLMWSFGLPITVVFAMLGLVLQGVARRRLSRPAWSCWLLFLLLSTTLTSLTPEIARLAPWAVRRQVEFALPLLAFGAAAWLLVLRVWLSRSGLRAVAAGVLIAFVLAGQWPAGLQAWRATEFNGMGQLLQAVSAHIQPEDVVVADHFKWATPLRRIYLKDVLNGEVWCAPSRPEDFQYALSRISGIAKKRGGRMLFLTSTEEKLGVFPGPDLAASLVWEAPVWRYSEVVQSPRARGIETRSKERIFRLYEATPASL